MDLQGKASSFPKPGAVLVKADNLTKREKALILYRHAKAAGLEATAKEIIRKHARHLIQTQHFTPERIRRLVKERLPAIAGELKKGECSENKIESELTDAIRNPTDRMRKAFKALDPAYKWLLISLLETGRFSTIDDLKSAYELHCPKSIRKPFEELVTDLSEAFVKVHHSAW